MVKTKLKLVGLQHDILSKAVTVTSYVTSFCSPAMLEAALTTSSQLWCNSELDIPVGSALLHVCSHFQTLPSLGLAELPKEPVASRLPTEPPGTATCYSSQPCHSLPGTHGSTPGLLQPGTSPREPLVLRGSWAKMLAQAVLSHIPVTLCPGGPCCLPRLHLCSLLLPPAHGTHGG